MFYHLGKFASRYRWLIVGLWTVAVVVALPFAPRVGQVLHTGGFTSPDAESERAIDLLTSKLHLNSVGLGGILVIALAVLAALTQLPAALAILGLRINALPVRLPRLRRRASTAANGDLQQGFWYRLSHFVSLVLPLKAIVMNTLSIMASYGALVIIFQNGFLRQLLNFTPLGFVEASSPILLFCAIFGLSMDYEVFLLSRISGSVLANW